MTPERLTGLGALLLEVRDYIRQTDPGSLDELVIDAAVDVLARLRSSLVQEGAK